VCIEDEKRSQFILQTGDFDKLEYGGITSKRIVLNAICKTLAAPAKIRCIQGTI